MGKLIVAFVLGVFVGVAGLIVMSCIVVGKTADEEYNKNITKTVTKTDE